ncbi:Urease operon accessory protein [Agrobacterium tumefaciens]|uniref:Urease operon accessory protein n=1 Tax=Agrobacterium tumefaciens TaxID=358 RepID=UPI001574EA8B|nr:Urease operon accessory protein [Agrobacterium tumefaciens]WCK01593.1 Urease operon accessory protein [Agrobacterium tumefaciens]
MGQRIMIVGNGDLPPGVAGFIDLSDIVIRFNDCRSLGAGGSRTDVVAVCNTGRPGHEMTEGRDWRDSDGVRQASAIWSVRDPAKFSEMEPSIRARWPELTDFCADHTAGFAAIAAETGKSHIVIPRAVHERLDAALTAYAPSPYVCPSTGLFAIAHVLESVSGDGDEVAIAGFGHRGWSGHPFAAEQQLVDALASERRLTRISPTSIFSAFEGA